mmetsp:Transcript_8337/g.20608  ORF Transcript_8337/g.20608 Transcript_8337/m.20608 type:complete len:424 (-) Transcript_8337:43-1314(-)
MLRGQFLAAALALLGTSLSGCRPHLAPQPTVSSELLLQDLSRYQDAVCTDGSPAKFYYRPAQTAESSNVWVVYLQGGGWCHSEVSCMWRCGHPKNPKVGNPMCSSFGLSRHRRVQGIFSPTEDTRLRNANQVYVPYCTSDAHMGNVSVFGWHFRGAVVVQSVLSELVNRHGLGNNDKKKDFMIFGGGSAGSRGAMVHLDYVPDMLGDAAKNVDVVGFLDSPLWVDMDPFKRSFMGFADMTKEFFLSANVEHLGDSCMEAYNVTDHWKCLFGEYRIPHLQTPFFLVASQYDSFQLGNAVGRRPQGAEEVAYAEDFANRTATAVRAIRQQWEGKTVKLHAGSFSSAVFSWACYNHCTSGGRGGFNLWTADGTTMDTALQAFLSWMSSGADLSWMDNCTGFACGDGCSRDHFQAQPTVAPGMRQVV